MMILHGRWEVTVSFDTFSLQIKLYQISIVNIIFYSFNSILAMMTRSNSKYKHLCYFHMCGVGVSVITSCKKCNDDRRYSNYHKEVLSARIMSCQD